MDKTPSTPFPILSPIARRWSPRASSPEGVDAVDLRALFEAARWAPSAVNWQPWRFIAAAVDDDPHGHELLAGLLADGNRVWAAKAPVLVLATTATEREAGAPDAWAEHDLGMAVATLPEPLQARELAPRARAHRDIIARFPHRNAALVVLG